MQSSFRSWSGHLRPAQGFNNCYRFAYCGHCRLNKQVEYSEMKCWQWKPLKLSTHAGTFLSRDELCPQAKHVCPVSIVIKIRKPGIFHRARPRNTQGNGLYPVVQNSARRKISGVYWSTAQIGRAEFTHPDVRQFAIAFVVLAVPLNIFSLG